MINPNEKEMRKIADEQILAYMSKKQFQTSKIPIHEHNGIDTVKIKERNIISNDKITTFLIVDTTETFSIVNLPNSKSIRFVGFAANNATDPATERCIINGGIELGPTYGFSGTGSSIAYDNNIPVPFIQYSNAMFVDSTDVAKNRVAATNQYFAYAVDDGSNVLVSAELISATQTSMTMTITLAATWKLQGSLIIT